MPVISSKAPDEVWPIKFIFDAETSSIQSAVVDVSVKSGIDANPNDILDGTAEINGGTITQYIKGGIEGVTYKITVLAVTAKAKYELAAITTIKSTS